jgi:hypothetical protein
MIAGDLTDAKSLHEIAKACGIGQPLLAGIPQIDGVCPTHLAARFIGLQNYFLSSEIPTFLRAQHRDALSRNAKSSYELASVARRAALRLRLELPDTLHPFSYVAGFPDGPRTRGAV